MGNRQQQQDKQEKNIFNSAGAALRAAAFTGRRGIEGSKTMWIIYKLDSTVKFWTPRQHYFMGRSRIPAAVSSMNRVAPRSRK
jgi:hypothetical protein